MRIKIYADGANKKDILFYNRQTDIAGLTTNPSLMRKSGVKNDFHNFLESFLTISCLFLTVIKWIILVVRSIFINISLRRIMINHKYSFLWINIFDDWKNSTCGRNAIENILYIDLMFYSRRQSL